MNEITRLELEEKNLLEVQPTLEKELEHEKASRSSMKITISALQTKKQDIESATRKCKERFENTLNKRSEMFEIAKEKLDIIVLLVSNK